MEQFKARVSDVTGRFIAKYDLDVCDDGLAEWAEELGLPVPSMHVEHTFDTSITVKMSRYHAIDEADLTEAIEHQIGCTMFNGEFPEDVDVEIRGSQERPA